MLWQGNMHSSFPGFFTSAGKIPIGATLPPKRSRKNKIKGPEQSYSQSLHQDPSSNMGMKQLLDIPYQTTFIIHSKARKFFLLLDPHHRITTAVTHEQWATTLIKRLTEKVYSCKKENMENLLAAAVGQTIFF